MNVVVMQPCYLPWRGYFALMRHADVFVHLDDVALPLGRSVQTRVALANAAGRHWLSLPVLRRRGLLVGEARLADDRWRHKHLATLRQELPGAAGLVEDLYARPWDRLADLTIALAERLARTLGLERRTLRSSTLTVGGAGSDKMLGLCRRLGATRYVTGHGAVNYLEHERFEEAGIAVEYLDYDLTPWREAADPYVTVLDALAHAPDPAAVCDGRRLPWRAFRDRRRAGSPAARAAG